MSTALITGANRGLGLEFCRQLQSRGWTVHACARDLADAPIVPGAVWHNLDVSDFAAIDSLARELDGNAIDLLVNNAGVAPRQSSSLTDLDYDMWRDVMNINTLAPIKMIEAFIGHIASSERKLIASMSSELGSMTSTQGSGLGRSGPWLPYRVSKAALNMAHLAIGDQLTEREITAVLLHPGWVATELGGTHAPMSAAASVQALLAVLDGVTAADHGKFLSYDGRNIPW